MTTEIGKVAESVIKYWNINVAAVAKSQEDDKPDVYHLECGVRKKKYYINKDVFLEKKIAEIRFFVKGKEDLLLWRSEIEIPKKVKNTPAHYVEDECMSNLYHSFFYEAFGVFAVVTKGGIQREDYAEYDLEKERLKQHDSAIDMVIQTIDVGPYYGKGENFDVFMDIDDQYYAVYTQHEIGQANNGIARMPKNHAIVTVPPKKKIILI